MKIITLFVFFSLSSAFAADAVFLRVLSRLNNDGVLPQQTLAYQAGGQNAELAQSCAIQLCGDSQSAPTAYITEARIDEWTRPEIMARFSEVEESLKKVIEANAQTNRAALASLRERLKQGDLALGKETTEGEYERLADAWFGSLLPMEFDLEKPLSERIKIDVVDVPTHSKTVKAALRSYADGFADFLRRDFTNACYYGVYSPEEAKAELKSRFEQLEPRYQAALKTEPQIATLYKEKMDEIRAKVNSKDAMDVNDVAGLNFYLQYYDQSIASLIAQPRIWSEVSSSKCVSEVCRRGLADLVAQNDWKTLADQMEAKLNDPQLADQQLNYCRSNFAALALQDSETERIREALPRVKAQFMERVTKNFSAHSREAFEKYLNETVSYNFANDPDMPLDDYIKRINDDAAEIQAVDLTTGPKVVERLLKIKNPYSDVLNLVTDADCGGLGASAWDSFMPVQPGNEEWVPSDGDPLKDNVQISHFSCTHPAQGEQILAHELGHALSNAFSDNELSESSYVEFMRLRECVNGWADPTVPNLPSSFVDHEGDLLRTEEDMADLVAYMFAVDNPALMSCALLEPELTGSGYVGPSIANPHLFDSHSSPLTRAIREAMHKRLTIPAACQQLTGPESGMRFNTCF